MGLRVVSGTAGGLRLVAPRASRPTTDRVREALFSALGHMRIEDAAVLDLYAGSGAFAIEALSRGAHTALLVDNDPAAEEACERNLVFTGFTDRGRFVRSEIEPALFREIPPEGPFDVVFCDPPYALPDQQLAGVLDGLVDWVAEDALVVVERPAPDWSPPRRWATFWQRKYGDTLVTVVNVAE